MSDPGKEPSKKLDDLATKVIGAAIEVHRTLGPGYLESVYENALCVELELRGIPYIKQKKIELAYKGHQVGEGRIDLLVNERLVVELKTVEEILPVHKAQVISYLKMTGLRLGLIINFKTEVLKKGIKRVVLSEA